MGQMRIVCDPFAIETHRAENNGHRTHNEKGSWPIRPIWTNIAGNCSKLFRVSQQQYTLNYMFVATYILILIQTSMFFSFLHELGDSASLQ